MSGFDHTPHAGTPEADKVRGTAEKMKQKGLQSLGGTKPTYDSSGPRAKAEAEYKARAAKRAKTLAVNQALKNKTP